MSSKINHAYDVLMDRDARIAFDGVHKKAGFASGSLQRTEGLAGPLNERAVPLGVHFSFVCACWMTVMCSIGFSLVVVVPWRRQG
jgi:hypothetical protein